ncbi:MAG: CvpA family protein [Sedimentisphaerales bacterium]|nr:CvpA family protein [Sedimentisphaerales bacterium]
MHIAMALLAVLLIIAGSAAIQYFKGNTAKAAATLIAVISCGFAALGLSEPLARLVGTYLGMLAEWADLLCFVLVFVLSFAILQTAISQILKEPIDLGKPIEQVARPILGAIIGYIISGVVLIGLALAPLPPGYPYPRFDSVRPDASRPKRGLLNPDGFLCGWFGLASRGSLAAIGNPQSFSLVRAGFLDQLYLNRLGTAHKVTRRTEGPAIEAGRPGVWQGPTDITDTQGSRLTTMPGHTFMLARIGFKRGALKDISPFLLGQVRLICKASSNGNPFSGKGRAIYPIGLMVGPRQIALKGLAESIRLEEKDFGREDSVRYIDFGFFVPDGWTPVLAQFKLNNMVQLSMAREQIPQVIPFGHADASGE